MNGMRGIVSISGYKKKRAIIDVVAILTNGDFGECLMGMGMEMRIVMGMEIGIVGGVVMGMGMVHIGER